MKENKNGLYLPYKKVNNRVIEFIADCKVFDLPPIGHDLALLDADSAVSGIIIHRLSKKFQKPLPGIRKRLDERCYTAWKENELAISFRTKANGFYRERLFSEMRIWLESALKGFYIDYKNVDAKLPPGETFVSSKGDVCSIAKLTNPTHWTYTVDITDQCIDLCHYHSAFREALYKLHPFSIGDEDLALLVDVHRGIITHTDYDQFSKKPLNWIITAWRFLHVATPCQGGRATTVDKDNEKRRLIDVQPMFNVILQFSVGQELRTCLRKNKFINLETGQELHARLTLMFHFCTIDSHSASDSISLYALTRVLPRVVYKHIALLRTPFTLIEGDYHYTYKVSAMGNGYTFELLSLLTACIGAISSSEFTAYGDDLIISDCDYSRCKKNMESFGFMINEDKSFYGSHNIRESCGAYSVRDYGLVPCYSIVWVANHIDFITLCNKIYLIQDQLKIIGPKTGSLKKMLLNLWEDIVSLCPASLKGPVPHFRGFNWSMTNFADYVWFPNYVRSLHSRKRLQETNISYRIAVRVFYNGPKLSDICVGTLLRKKQVVERTDRSNVDSVTAILSCSSGKLQNRFNRGDLNVSPVTVIYFENAVIPLHTLRDLRNDLFRLVVTSHVVVEASFRERRIGTT